ncbi:MAG: DUF4465 domain-containing protein [Bacteroidales bacterium]|nr:DUF4465 domain-containing protein [Bacteroidales bacterium]
MRISYLCMVVLLLAVASCNSDDVVTPAPTIYFSSDGEYEIGPTDTLILEPKITYDRSSVYSWLVDGKEVSSELNLEFIPDGMREYYLTFMATNANGADTFNVHVSVVKNIEFDTFDNFTVSSKSALYMQTDTVPNEYFVANDVKFPTQINADTTMWGGMAFSNRTTTSSTLSTAAIGCAYTLNGSTSTSYAAMSGYGDIMYALFTERTYSVKSIDITNDNFSYLVSKYGYTSADSTLIISHFQTDDYLRLNIYGLNFDGSDASSVSFDLVDCHYDNPAKYVRISDWTTVDLTPLGQVFGLRFELECSKENFPPFFCIDNLKLQD